MRQPKKFETHYIRESGEAACITASTVHPEEVTCKRCLRRMGRYTSPREARSGRVKRIVDGIMDAVRAALP